MLYINICFYIIKKGISIIKLSLFLNRNNINNTLFHSFYRKIYLPKSVEQSISSKLKSTNSIFKQEDSCT